MVVVNGDDYATRHDEIFISKTLEVELVRGLRES